MQHFVLLLTLLFGYLGNALANDTMKVGIKPSEPWVMYDSNLPEVERQPVGFSIDLWQAIAKELGVKTQWVYHDSTKKLVKSVAKEQVDVGISAITILSHREKKLDFSNSMYELGLQIMVAPANQNSNPLSILASELGKLVSLKNMLWFALMLIITVHLRWWVDRYDEENHFFSRRYSEGIQAAFWWGLTMLITWETPKSRGIARVIDLSWHLIGLIALSIVTAVVTAALTSQAVKGSIQSEKDLFGKRVAAVTTDAPRYYLQKIGINPIQVDNLQQGMELLLTNKADALVHDGPRLSYLADQYNRQNENDKSLAVLPALFNHQNYGLAFPTDSPYVEKVNQVLLQLREAHDSDVSIHQRLREKWVPNP